MKRTSESIEAWDDAITALEKSISIAESIEFELYRNGLHSEIYQVLGQAYLKQYYSHESLDGGPETGDEVTHNKTLLFSKRSIEIRRAAGGVSSSNKNDEDINLGHLPKAGS